MAAYSERPSKNVLKVSKTTNPVKIKMDCFSGTTGSTVVNSQDNSTNLFCGDTATVGQAKALKEKGMIASIGNCLKRLLIIFLNQLTALTIVFKPTVMIKTKNLMAWTILLMPFFSFLRWCHAFRFSSLYE